MADPMMKPPRQMVSNTTAPMPDKVRAAPTAPVTKPVAKMVSNTTAPMPGKARYQPVAKAETSQRMMTPAAQKKAAGVQSAKAFTPAVKRKAERKSVRNKRAL